MGCFGLELGLFRLLRAPTKNAVVFIAPAFVAAAENFPTAGGVAKLGTVRVPVNRHKSHRGRLLGEFKPRTAGDPPTLFAKVRNAELTKGLFQSFLRRIGRNQVFRPDGVLRVGRDNQRIQKIRVGCFDVVDAHQNV